VVRPWLTQLDAEPSSLCTAMVVPATRASLSRGLGYDAGATTRRPGGGPPQQPLQAPWAAAEEPQLWRGAASNAATTTAQRGQTPKRRVAAVPSSTSAAQANGKSFGPGLPLRPRSSPHGGHGGARGRPRPPSAGPPGGATRGRRGSGAVAAREAEQALRTQSVVQSSEFECLLQQGPAAGARGGLAQQSFASARRCYGGLVGTRPATSPVETTSPSSQPVLPRVLQISNMGSFVPGSATDRMCAPRIRSTSEFALYIQTVSGGGYSRNGSASTSTLAAAALPPRRPLVPSSSVASQPGPPFVAAATTTTASASSTSPAPPPPASGGGGAAGLEGAAAEDRTCIARASTMGLCQLPRRRSEQRSPSPPTVRPGASWRCGPGCGPEGWLGRCGGSGANAERGAMRLDAEVRARRRDRGKASKEKHFVLPFWYAAADARCAHLESTAATPPTTMLAAMGVHACL